MGVLIKVALKGEVCRSPLNAKVHIKLSAHGVHSVNVSSCFRASYLFISYQHSTCQHKHSFSKSLLSSYSGPDAEGRAASLRRGSLT